MRLFHLVEPAEWSAASAVGVYRPASLSAEGFVHFSFADQVSGTANLLYRDRAQLVVVEIESDLVDAELRIEDSSSSGTEFPHVYGPIPTAAMVALHPLHRDASGDWEFTPPR